MLSQTTGVAIAKQSSLGTAATTGFHRMRLSRSRAIAQFDYEDALNEHTGVHQRASNRQSTPDRVGQILPVSMTGLLYPNAIGALLVGMGFLGTPTDNTTYYSHAFTKADVDAALYLSLMQAIGEDSARFERKIRDIRLTELTLRANRRNIEVSAQGLGIQEAASAGTETVAAEPIFRMVPFKGATTWGAQALGSARETTITIRRPVDEEDQKLHSFLRADLPETGFEIMVAMTGLDLSYNFYKKLEWGGTSGTDPDEACITDSLSVGWASNANISGAGVPYSLTIALTKAEIRLSNIEPQGNGIVRGDLEAHMIDDVSSAPVTVTLANGVSAY